MSDLSQLSATFQDIIDMMGSNAQSPDQIAHPPEAAYSALRDVLGRTVLPRRITVRGASGARLSMVVKDREVIRVAEVHPMDLWGGDAPPQETTCRDDDVFAHPFALALHSVIGSEPIHIEQALLTDPLGVTRPGYPAARIVEPTEETPAAPEAETLPDQPALDFFRAFPTLPRARFGAKTVIEIQGDSPVDQGWMQARVEEMLIALRYTETALQLLYLDGNGPVALALVWTGGEGCIALATDQSDFTAIERHLDTLRTEI